MTFTFNGMNIDSPIVQSMLKKDKNNGILPEGSIPNSGTIKVSHVTEETRPDGTVIEHETEPQEVKVDTSNLDAEMQDIIDTVHKYQRGEFNNYDPHNENCNCGCRDNKKINIGSAIGNRTNNNQSQQPQQNVQQQQTQQQNVQQQQAAYQQAMYQQQMIYQQQLQQQQMMQQQQLQQQMNYGCNQQQVYYDQYGRPMVQPQYVTYYDQYGRQLQTLYAPQPTYQQQQQAAYQQQYMFGNPNGIDYTKPIFNGNPQQYQYGYVPDNNSGALSGMILDRQVKARQEQKASYEQQHQLQQQQQAAYQQQVDQQRAMFQQHVREQHEIAKQQAQQRNANIPLHANNVVSSSSPELNFSQLSTPTQDQQSTKRKVKITPDMPKYLQDVIKYNQGYIPEDMDPDPWIAEHGLQYEDEPEGSLKGSIFERLGIEPDDRPYGEGEDDNVDFSQFKNVAAEKHAIDSQLINNISNIKPLPQQPIPIQQPVYQQQPMYQQQAMYQQQYNPNVNMGYNNNYGYNSYRYGYSPMNSQYAYNNYNNSFNPYSAAQQQKEMMEQQKQLEQQQIEKAKAMSRAVHKSLGKPISEEELEAIYNPKPVEMSEKDKEWYQFQAELATAVPREQIMRPIIEAQWKQAHDECTKYTRPDMSCMEFLKEAAPKMLYDIMVEEEQKRRHEIMDREGLNLAAYGLTTIQNNTNGLVNNNLSGHNVKYTTANAASYASRFYTQRQQSFFDAILKQGGAS